MKDAKGSQLAEPQQGVAEGDVSKARALLHVAIALAAGLMLRVWLLGKLFEVNGDSLIYGGLAKNLLLHGRFALTLPSGEMYPTLIRLPGYPLFLAACFRLFGMENYFSAACVQVAMDLVSCMLLADFARRMAPAQLKNGAALAALWLGALCPFTASYAAFPLTETATICMLALAMWAMARFRERPGWGNALCFTFAVTCAGLLRPDGVLAALAFAPGLLIGLRTRGEVTETVREAGPVPTLATKAETSRGWSTLFSKGSKSVQELSPAPTLAKLGWSTPGIESRKLIRMTVVCVLLALAPFGAWAARNWNVFHVFEPLAPRSAADPGENTNPGWERWVKTWCLDFVSTYQIYWNVPWDKLDVSELPSRAFDSPAQYVETAALAAEYNGNGYELTPTIDAEFERLAEERISMHPLRYYVWLPLGRVADMWLRPRVENLPIDLDWWVYAHHHAETKFSWAYAGLNAAYLVLGVAGLLLRPRFYTPRTKACPWGPRLWGALLAYMVLRSVLLLTIDAPETRYTLECFPMLIAGGAVAAAAGWDGWTRKRTRPRTGASFAGH